MKQGFIAFFLTAALSMLLLLPALSAPTAPTSTKLSTLELEKAQFTAANSKRALISHLKHALPALAPGLSSPNPKIRAAADAALSASLAGFELYAEQAIGSGASLDFWCGTAPYSELDSLARMSSGQASPKKCTACLDLGNPLCTQYLNINSHKRSAQAFGPVPGPLAFSGFGLTLCTHKNSICLVSLLPQDYEVFF